MTAIKNRIFAVPDIHGRLDLLDLLLLELTTNHSLDLTVDKIVFLGDMIDRGADSKGVIDRIKDLVDKHPDNVIALAGNHEWLCIDAHTQHSFDAKHIWWQNGGHSTLKSFELSNQFPSDQDEFPKPVANIPDDYIKWMASLPLSYEDNGFFFSHAPAPKEEYRSYRNQGQDFTRHELTWTYDVDEESIARDHGSGVIAYCGHIHRLWDNVMAPRFYEHYVFCDSGCGCSPKAPLVAVECGTQNVVYAWPT